MDLRGTEKFGECDDAGNAQDGGWKVVPANFELDGSLLSPPLKVLPLLHLIYFSQQVVDTEEIVLSWFRRLST